MKLKWKVAPAPTGRYRSFEKRSWPAAVLPDGRTFAAIYCEDGYVPAAAREGSHGPLAVEVLDYSMGHRPLRRKMIPKFATLDRAKAEVERLLAERPELAADPTVPCKHCAKPTIAKATRLCDPCWELERRISMDLPLAEKILNSLKEAQSNG